MLAVNVDCNSPQVNLNYDSAPYLIALNVYIIVQKLLIFSGIWLYRNYFILLILLIIWAVITWNATNKILEDFFLRVVRLLPSDFILFLTWNMTRLFYLNFCFVIVSYIKIPSPKDSQDVKNKSDLLPSNTKRIAFTATTIFHRTVYCPTLWELDRRSATHSEPWGFQHFLRQEGRCCWHHLPSRAYCWMLPPGHMMLKLGF